MKCNHPHACGNWDGMFITPLMTEFEACDCECNSGAWEEYIKTQRKYLSKWEKELIKDWENDTRI